MGDVGRRRRGCYWEPDRDLKAMRLTTFAAVLGFAALTAAAQDAAAQLKIAVVNPDEAIGQCEEFKAFRNSLLEEFSDEQAAVQQLQKDIEALQQRVVDERDVMSETELRDVQKEVENKSLDLEFRGKKLQKDVGDRQNEFLQEMSPKFHAVVNDLIEIERYDVVFERRSVLYANVKHNITAKVTEKLNERYAEQQAQVEG